MTTTQTYLKVYDIINPLKIQFEVFKKKIRRLIKYLRGFRWVLGRYKKKMGYLTYHTLKRRVFFIENLCSTSPERKLAGVLDITGMKSVLHHYTI